MKEFIKKIIKLFATNRLLVFPGKIVIRIIRYAILCKGGDVVFCKDPHRLKVMELGKKIYNEQALGISVTEACQIFMAVERTAKVNGDIAEVGVWKGGSAKIICEAKGEKALYLFDTFEGLPDLCEMDNPNQYYKGEFRWEFEKVKNYLRNYPNVYIYKGIFPSTSEPIKDKRFSFVNLDVDLYKSTLSCLEFFYPRMNKGGVIISHDYIGTQGVKKALDDFFEEKSEPIIELSGCQCLIVKC
jgi:hypothetical protein